MQKWLILRLGVLLSGCLSVAAQTHATQVVLIREPSTPLLMLIPVVPAQLASTLVPQAQPTVKTLPSLNLRVLAESPEQGLKGLLSVEVVKTMFATDTRVPIVQLPSGLQLDGFARTYDLGNVLLGPSGLRHPGLRIPLSVWVYGISLRFRLGRDAGTERPLISSARRCRNCITDHGGQR